MLEAYQEAILILLNAKFPGRISEDLAYIIRDEFDPDILDRWVKIAITTYSELDFLHESEIGWIP